MAGKRFQFTLSQLFVTMTVMAIVCVVFIPPAINFSRTGFLFPISKIDRLAKPVSVAGWHADGFLLRDGRKVVLPGICGLPASSAAVALVSKRGIDVGSGGVHRVLFANRHSDQLRGTSF
jgi:hypothetical protein